MSALALTEWLNSPETRALVTYLKFRQAAQVAAFLKGQPVELITQGQAAGYNEIERLLKQSPEEINRIFENANRELNEQHRRT